LQIHTEHGEEPYTLGCTRPEGQDGKHSACTTDSHAAEVWEA
jgi:hypothetical protein